MKQIVVTSEYGQLRAAVMENGRLLEVLDDTGRESRLSGSIFKGRVTNIVPGMQAAFVDIGIGKNAFLYAGDASVPERLKDKEIRAKVIPAIENFLSEGQDIIVQVIRDPAGNKGPRVTTEITLPGRFAVLLPGDKEYTGISQKITDEGKRQFLSALAKEIKPADAGIIIRTLAAEASEKELRDDVHKLHILRQHLDQIKEKAKKGLLYSGNDTFSRLLRDFIDDSVDEIIVDNGDLAQSLRGELKKVCPAAAGRVRTNFKAPLFEYYRINQQIRDALSPKVVLESGGYLVIEQTEALAAIDVNSGKLPEKIFCRILSFRLIWRLRQKLPGRSD
jgi:ribonuclease G